MLSKPGPKKLGVLAETSNGKAPFVNELEPNAQQQWPLVRGSVAGSDDHCDGSDLPKVRSLHAVKSSPAPHTSQPQRLGFVESSRAVGSRPGYSWGATGTAGLPADPGGPTCMSFDSSEPCHVADGNGSGPIKKMGPCALVNCGRAGGGDLLCHFVISYPGTFVSSSRLTAPA